MDTPLIDERWCQTVNDPGVIRGDMASPSVKICQGKTGHQRQQHIFYVSLLPSEFLRVYLPFNTSEKLLILNISESSKSAEDFTEEGQETCSFFWTCLSTGKMSLLLLDTWQWCIQDFSERMLTQKGCDNLLFEIFCRKLYENENIWTGS